MDGIKVVKEKEIIRPLEVVKTLENQPAVGERFAEQPSSTREGQIEVEGSGDVELKSTSTMTTPVPAVDPELEARRKKIESIMSAGLEEIYAKLDSTTQQKFRLAGEATASQINIMLSQGKIQIFKIINLIKNWLKLIPGANRFFLEQEAKIKTDSILQLNKKGGEQ
jgi:hypothetical protein